MGKPVPAKPHQPVAGKTHVPHPCPFSKHWLSLLKLSLVLGCGTAEGLCSNGTDNWESNSVVGLRTEAEVSDCPGVLGLTSQRR